MERVNRVLKKVRLETREKETHINPQAEVVPLPIPKTEEVPVDYSGAVTVAQDEFNRTFLILLI